MIDTTCLHGITDYQPTELYLTAYAGTRLDLIEQTLAKHNQMLSFEPPQFNSLSTLGGTVACGFSGPRRPYADAIRDCILGIKLINGKGQHLTFGGKVMKNVAGYDVSRLMCGALGTLGLITQVSIRVMPKPADEMTLQFDMTFDDALKNIQQWCNSLIPLTATFFYKNRLWLRISGLESVLDTLHKQIGGEVIKDSEYFWRSIKNHQADFFCDQMPLWRCIVPHDINELPLDGETCFEWNGGLRWIKTDESPQKVFETCRILKGHATLFRSPSQKPNDCFAPVTNTLKQLHMNIKHAFDPARILNPGRMYSWC